MLLFVIASFFLSKQQTSKLIGNKLDAGHQNITKQYENLEKPLK
jgi:hypothetical protein